QAAQFALAAAEGDELGLVGGGLIVDVFGGFVDGDLEFLEETQLGLGGQAGLACAAAAAGLAIEFVLLGLDGEVADHGVELVYDAFFLGLGGLAGGGLGEIIF